MLKWMRLKNLALVDKADMEFGPGFNVITGETGAGKSGFCSAGVRTSRRSVSGPTVVKSPASFLSAAAPHPA